MKDFFEFICEADPDTIYSASKVEGADEYVVYWMEEDGLNHKVYETASVVDNLFYGSWRVLS